MSDGRLALIFFEVGLVLTLISMVLGPFGIADWSIAAAAVACITAIGGMYLAFSSWEEPEEKSEESENPCELVDNKTTQ